MRESGSDSWRFSEDVPTLLHLALFVRDAVGLPVPVTADLPPRLDGRLPDRTDAIPEAAKPAAADQWTRWWDAILDAESATHDRTPEPNPAGAADQQAAARARLAAVRETMQPVSPEPPDFAALAGSPDLQRAVAATFAEGTRFSERRRRDLLFHDRPAQLPWVLLRDTAERLSAERGVPIGALHGQVMVLMASGEWWRLRSPGVALATVAAARNRAIATELVAQVFTSALDG